MQKLLINFLKILSILNALWLVGSCSKSTPFGSELLVDEVADFIFTDTVTVHCKMVQEDPLVTSDPNSTADHFLCGKLNDPQFGKHEAEVFTALRLTALSPNFKNNDGSQAKLDSAYFLLRLDRAGFYGDSTVPQTFKIYQLNTGNHISLSKNYYATDYLPADREIASVTTKISPSRQDSFYVGKGKTREFIGRAPFIKVPVDMNFVREIFEYDRKIDSLDFAIDSLFFQRLRGLKITNETPNGNMMTGLDLNDPNFSRLVIFYTRNSDTVSSRYSLTFAGGNKFVHFKHDYKDTPADTAIKSNNPELLYLQGMAGIKILVDFPYAPALKSNGVKVAVNKAELVMYAADFSGNDESIYPIQSQLILTDTSKVPISDILDFTGAQFTQGFLNFGGSPKKKNINGQEVQQYSMQITRRFQNMIDQKASGLQGTKLILNTYPKITVPRRTIFYSQKHSTFPAKLLLKYTKIQ